MKDPIKPVWPFRKKKSYSTITLGKTVISMQGSIELFVHLNSVEDYETLQAAALTALKIMEGEEEN